MTTMIDGNMMVDTEKQNRNVLTFNQILSYISIDHSQKLHALRELTSQVKNEELSLVEMIDIGYLLRECEKIIDEMRKDFKAHKEMIEKITCYRLSVEDKESCRGSLATGKLRAKYHSNAPHPVRESEKFLKLCEFFGMDTDRVPVGMVRFHWPTMKQYVTHCMEEGVELPEELSDVNVELVMSYRRLANGKE